MATFTLTRKVEVNDTEIALLRELAKHNFLWNYATDGFELEVFDSVVGKDLADEDGDGRVNLNGNGREILNLI